MLQLATRVSSVEKWVIMLTVVRRGAIQLHRHLGAVFRGRVSRQEVISALLREAEVPRAMHVAR